MPTGREIIKEFVKFIHSHYNLAIPDFHDSVDNDLYTTDQAITNIKAEGAVPGIIKTLLDCFLESNLDAQFLIDQFPNIPKIEILDFATQDFRKRNRPFCISDTQFGYLSTKKMFDFNPLSSIIAEPEGHKALIDFTGAAVIQAPPKQLLINFLLILETTDINKGLLIHKFPHTYSSLSIYSYLYFQELMQGGVINIDPILRYTGTHGSTTVFSHVILYQQYFELYDILNELNHSQEIVTRFLKVYHLLEYLIYRVELVKIEAKARGNRSFIREIHGLTGKQSEKEFHVFKRNFELIFNAEIVSSYFDFGGLNADQTNFFRDYLDLNPYNPIIPSHVAQLIYKLRNSIVHNKESEFHMTTTNPDSFIEIIPLLNVLIEKLERTVYNKISTNFNQISYQSNAIELY